jgi:hypothetical protein
MGLKDLKSNLDIVQGPTAPVDNMSTMQGPSFDNGPSSTLHVNSLSQVPGGDSNSPYQDLNGVPDPHFNTLKGTKDSPFYGKDSSGDHLKDLLEDKIVRSTNSSNIYDPQQMRGISPGPPVPGGDQDLDGLNGPNFDTGNPSKVHADPTQTTPTQLVKDYTSTVNPGANYGNSTWPVVPAVNQDLNGVNGPAFDGSVLAGNTTTLHTDLLENIYQSSVNPGSNYGAGQPGGTWPSISPGTHDLDGNLPSNGEYLNSLPQ